MLRASDRMEGSPGRVWSYSLVSGPPCHRTGFHPRPCALGSQEATALTPQSLGLPQGEAKGAGMGRAGGHLLTNQLVGLSAFQGRRESLRASLLRKTKNRIGKEGRKEGWEEG